MDWTKYGVLVSTHPDTAWMAPDILNQIAQKKLVDAETMNQELTGYEKRMGAVMSLARWRLIKIPMCKKGTDLDQYGEAICWPLVSKSKRWQQSGWC